MEKGGLEIPDRLYYNNSNLNRKASDPSILNQIGPISNPGVSLKNIPGIPRSPPRRFFIPLIWLAANLLTSNHSSQ